MCVNELNGIEKFFNNAAFGAFLGAFSAFIFGLIAYDYTKKREKWVTHHNALVKTEHLANRHLNQISGNIHLLRGAIEVYDKGAFSENVLSPLDNPELRLEYHNIEMVNTYVDYQSLVEKVNHDAAGWNRSNDRLFNAALGGVPAQDIAVNRKHLKERTEDIIHHMEDLMEETYTIGAYVRVFMRVDKRDKFARLGKTEKIEIPLDDIAQERAVFVKDSEDRMEQEREGRLKKYTQKKDESKNSE